MSYEYKQFYRRNLPHIHSPGATLFITFRLAGSIPKSVIRYWQAERQRLESELENLKEDTERDERSPISDDDGLRGLRTFLTRRHPGLSG